MSSFLSTIAEKAQNALNQTPLANHIPGHSPSSTPGVHHPGAGGSGAEAGSGAGQSGSGGFLKSHAFENISHQFRTFQQQYTCVVVVLVLLGVFMLI